MPITQQDLPYPKKGDRPAHTDITRLSAAMSLLQRQVAGQSVDGEAIRGPWVAIEHFIGIIDVTTSSAPDGMFFVARAIFPPTYDPTVPAVAVVDTMFPAVVLATNLNSSPVPVGQQVMVTRWKARTAFVESGAGNLTVTGGTFLFTFAYGGGWIRVNLIQNGGADGVANMTLATWTYDVFTELPDGSSGTQIGTAVAVEKKRIFASPIIQANKGLAYYGPDGLLRIWDCDEAYNNGCPT